MKFFKKVLIITYCLLIIGHLGPLILMMPNIAHFIIRVLLLYKRNSPADSIGKFVNNPRLEVDIGKFPFQTHIRESCTHLLKLMGYSIDGIQSVQYMMC